MRTQIDTKWIAKVAQTLIDDSDCRSATKYLSPELVVRATWQLAPHVDNGREEMRITYGVPNYKETIFIVKALNAGEPFPVKKIQKQPWPVKRAKKVKK